jgi:hypothetical protein
MRLIRLADPRLDGYGDSGTGRECGRFGCELGTEAKAAVINA